MKMRNALQEIIVKKKALQNEVLFKLIPKPF